ncbi:MAG: alpha/beta hydrolase [Candidatus Nanopelagicales bacterium]
MHREYDLVASDGTRLTAWTNDGHGTPVLVCNGMGVPPEAWPRLLDPGCGYEVAGWNHRGGMGSDRPQDPSRIEILDHVDDALALMDQRGWERALLVSWSLGVNVSFELAARHPDRVLGLLSVAGVPGGTYDTLFAPLLVPRPLRRPVGLAVTHSGKLMGRPLSLLARSVPKGRTFAEVLRHSGFMLPYADPDDVVPWLQTFLRHDFDWYFELALALARHEALDPSFVTCPVTIAAGRWDVLTSMHDVVAISERIPHAEVHVLPGTHFLPLEFPDRIMRMLDDLRTRADDELAEAG